MPQVPTSDKAVSITSAILPMFLTVFVNLSLLLQAYTVLKTVSKSILRHIATLLSCLAFLNAMGWRLAEAILNVKAIVSAATFYEYTWLINGALASETAAIWYFTIVFTAKLALNLAARRLLNQPSWSKMEVITVMAVGTMIIPCKFVPFSVSRKTHADIEQRSLPLSNGLIQCIFPKLDR